MFRKEAISAKRQKLSGNVFLVQPVSFYTLGFLVLALVGLACFLLLSGSYARSETVIGHLVPGRGLVKIQIARFGTLESIHVRQGHHVKTRQKLATIRTATPGEDGKQLAQEISAALNRQAVELQTQIILEKNRLETELASLKTEQEELRFRVDSLLEQLELQRQLGDLSKRAFESVQDLTRTGYVSRDESERRRQGWLKQQAEQKFTEQELAAARMKVRRLAIRLQQLPGESRQRIARLEAQYAELEARQAETAGAEAYIITSPVNGRVVSVNVDSVGRSVRAGQALLTIVADGSQLKADLFVPSRAIGFIESGQEVRLLYDAFPYQFYGSRKGTITAITEIVLGPGEVLAPFDIREPVYRVSASIEDEIIHARGKSIGLQAGMTLRGNIILERRSFLEWVLEPLYALGERS